VTLAAGALGGFPGGVTANAPLASTYFNMRKTTIYGGSNEVQHRRLFSADRARQDCSRFPSSLG
jgi:alkylation response protein AidB-like acyl-CoA dehydrogenase